jgi:hypothetical protein
VIGSLKFKSSDGSWAWWPMLVILVIWETQIRRIKVLGQPGKKKFSRFHYNQKGWAWWYIPAIA